MITATPASEALYFDGAPLAHVVAYEERKRLARIDRENRRAARAIRTVSRFASDAEFRTALAAENAEHRASVHAAIDRGMEPINRRQRERWAAEEAGL